ncbi:unnamed protein product [Urochloa humidicola]
MAPAAVLTEPPLPDEVMEDIFLRLDDAADLARASAACTSFRRVVRGRRFLLRFRSLHPPPVLCLGRINWPAANGVFHPAEPPYRFAPAARALAQAADFTFSFLPDPQSWVVRDARDGRVLLSRHITTTTWSGIRPAGDITTTFADLVVADPLHRRYVQIPSIPGDLLPTRRHHEDDMKFEPFLAPACEDDEGLSFRVLYNVMSQYKVVTFVFSSVTEEWCHAASISFLPHRLIHNPTKLVRYCIHSCFYWAHRNDTKTYMLVLDPRPLEMKFSVVALLLDKSVVDRLAVVDAGEDRLGVLILWNGRRNLDLYCKTWRNNVVCAEGWQHDKTIPLPEHNSFWELSDAGAPEGYLLMCASIFSELQLKRRYFTLDLKALLFQRIYESDQLIALDLDLLYTSFPPPLSPPSI